MRVDVITLFPQIVEGALSESIIARARKEGRLELYLHQLRDYALDRHRTVDDAPYGGGPGMVLRVDVIAQALDAVRAMDNRKAHVVLLSASGWQFQQATAYEWSKLERLILICGHYEGVDQRVADYLVDQEVSIGPYVLTNGALAAAVLIDATVRLLPGVLGNEKSIQEESFSESSFELEGPQYTRPAEYRGWRVPEILLSGHHEKIRAWRKEQAHLKATRLNKP
ncbi:MAG: tRNA (guanosine(37)-N1)-methyltransferase TrmD [Methylacidiphilales bacterium]|nr:tRNA (guanosine(37)-N1)-methyltransferase TrmD [Candidatus Methylacidiphilales bacterium]MDW8348829.1 tRNA (guanosine(37)-N1)-methyltransferase TrmD [Verrucomicrobiae bacterium]